MGRQRWQLAPAVAGGNGRHQHLTAAIDKGGGWHLMVAIDGSCGSGSVLGLLANLKETCKVRGCQVKAKYYKLYLRSNGCDTRNGN